MTNGLEICLRKPTLSIGGPVVRQISCNSYNPLEGAKRADKRFHVFAGFLVVRILEAMIREHRAMNLPGAERRQQVSRARSSKRIKVARKSGQQGQRIGWELLRRPGTSMVRLRQCARLRQVVSNVAYLAAQHVELMVKNYRPSHCGCLFRFELGSSIFRPQPAGLFNGGGARAHSNHDCPECSPRSGCSHRHCHPVRNRSGSSHCHCRPVRDVTPIGHTAIA